MNKSKPDSENAPCPSEDTSRPAFPPDCELYRNGEEIAGELGTVLLSDIRIEDKSAEWQKGLALLETTSWGDQCAGLAEHLVRLRQISPLDVVGVSSLSENVPLRPLVCALGVGLKKLFQRVVLMDCDLRSPSFHTVTDASGREGFVDMVKHGCSFFTGSRETEVEGLYVVAAGSHPVMSEGELVGKELERTFNSMRAKADITLAVIPPLLVGKRVNPLLQYVDGVLLCVNRNAAVRSAVRSDFARLWKSDVPVIGMVNYECSDFEERKTLVLGAIPQAGEGPEAETPEMPSEPVGRDVEERKSDSVPLRAFRSSGAPSGAESVSRIPLEHSPEYKPLLKKGADVGGPRVFFGTKPRQGESHPETPLQHADVERGEGDRDVLGAGSGSKYERFLDRELFGRRKLLSKPGRIVGFFLLAAAILIAAVVIPRIGGPPPDEITSSAMRSILLPGSDGVVTADEAAVETVPGAESPSSPESQPGPGLGPAAGSRTPAHTGAVSVDQAVPPGRPGAEIQDTEGRHTPQPEQAGMALPGRDTDVETPAEGRFYVHVSSHKAYRNALQDSASVARAGVRVSIQFVSLSQLGRWYRVLAGPFDSEEGARSAASTIQPLGLVKKVRIIQEGVSE